MDRLQVVFKDRKCTFEGAQNSSEFNTWINK